MGVLDYMKYKKRLHFVELLISLEEYNQCDQNSSTQKTLQKSNTQNAYNHNLLSLEVLGKDPVKHCKKLKVKPKIKFKENANKESA